MLAPRPHAKVGFSYVDKNMKPQPEQETVLFANMSGHFWDKVKPINLLQTLSVPGTKLQALTQ